MKIARSLSFCQKTIVFSDNLCFDSAEHESPESFHAETFSLWRKGKARQACLSRPKAQSPAAFCLRKTAGQAHRSAPHKILCKSPALPTFTPLPATCPRHLLLPRRAIHLAAARPRPLCGREGLSLPFLRNRSVSKGTASPLDPFRRARDRTGIVHVDLFCRRNLRQTRMVMTAPVSTTTKPAPAARRAERTLTTNWLGRPSNEASSDSEYCVLAMQTADGRSPCR